MTAPAIQATTTASGAGSRAPARAPPATPTPAETNSRNQVVCRRPEDMPRFQHANLLIR